MIQIPVEVLALLCTDEKAISKAPFGGIRRFTAFPFASIATVTAPLIIKDEFVAVATMRVTGDQGVELRGYVLQGKVRIPCKTQTTTVMVGAHHASMTVLIPI